MVKSWDIMLMLPLLVLLTSLLMSQQNSITELGVEIEACLGTPAYFEAIVNTKCLLFFEGGGWGEVFLFLASDLVGGTIGCGFPP